MPLSPCKMLRGSYGLPTFAARKNPKFRKKFPEKSREGPSLRGFGTYARAAGGHRTAPEVSPYPRRGRRYSGSKFRLSPQIPPKWGVGGGYRWYRWKLLGEGYKPAKFRREAAKIFCRKVVSQVHRTPSHEDRTCIFTYDTCHPCMQTRTASV